MKTGTYTYKLMVSGALVSLAGFMFSCGQTTQNTTQQNSKNALLPSEVVIKYEHSLLTPQEAEKLKGVDYVPFVKKMATAIKNGLAVYDPMDRSKTMDQQNIDYLLNDRTDTLLSISEQTLDTLPTIKKYHFVAGDVKRLVLKEKWFFDAENFSMDKSVVEYAPIRVSETEVAPNSFETKKQMLFWLKDKGSDKTLLAENVTYEFDLYNSDNPSWVESLSASRLINIILSNVLNGKVTAYDFFANEKIALSTDIVKEELGATVENYYVEDEDGNITDTVQVVGNIYPEEIRSVIFVEDWYIDDKMMISKKVKQIAPVRHYYMISEVGDDEIVKKIPFVVDLN